MVVGHFAQTTGFDADGSDGGECIDGGLVKCPVY